MGADTFTSGGPEHGPKPPHVLFLPKWWPNPDDPQLGDFLRKQALAVAARTKASVLYIRGDKAPGASHRVTTTEENGLWELHVHYPASTASFAPWRKAVNFTRFSRAVQQGWHVLTTQRGLPELAHVHIMVRPALIALWLKRKYGIPYLLSEQSSEYLDGSYARKSAIHHTISRYLFRQAAAISAVSAWLGDALVGHGLCDHYAVVPNVVPGLDRPLPPMGPPGRFLVIADLVDRTKNVSGVIRALSVARVGDARIQLTIIGDGPDRPYLEDLSRQLGVEPYVRFLGRLPNTGVLDHVAHETAVIINSNVETFSVVTGEALAQGKPVIATRCGGPIAFVTPENGLLIDVGDEDALAKAMLDLTANAANYSPDIIRRSVSSRFSPDAVGHAFTELYYRIMADHHGQ